MKWHEMSTDQQYWTLHTMVARGEGGFVSNLASAWQLADSTNSKRLALAFQDLVLKYGPKGGLYLHPKEPGYDEFVVTFPRAEPAPVEPAKEPAHKLKPGPFDDLPTGHMFC